jgi:hypothetical protein
VVDNIDDAKRVRLVLGFGEIEGLRRREACDYGADRSALSGPALLRLAPGFLPREPLWSKMPWLVSKQGEPAISAWWSASIAAVPAPSCGNTAQTSSSPTWPS